MHAIEVAEIGGPEILTYVDKPRPGEGPGEVVIKAEAIGVTFVLGAEVAGTVAAVGDGGTALRAGDRVASADAVGTYAEYCVVPADLVASVPDGVGSDVAAAAILKGMTAHLLITSVFPVRPGDAVLLHAGAGGVGLILTQWATSLGPVSSPRPPPRRRRRGHARPARWRCSAVATTRSSSAPRSARSADGNGAAAVYDGVGKSTVDASLASLAIRGTLALFGAANGPVSPLDPQRLNAVGSVYFTRPSRPHFIRTRDEFAWRTEELFHAIASGTITVTVSAHYPSRTRPKRIAIFRPARPSAR
jgi:NADPH2:quinone reductase